MREGAWYCVSMDEKWRAHQSFEELLDEQYKYGQVTDATLTRLGFQIDTRLDGSPAGCRPDGGYAEHMQRAKCLTHEHQVQLRDEVMQRAQAKKRKREDDARMKAVNFTNMNRECEKLLIKAVMQDSPRVNHNGVCYNASARHVGLATLKMFSGLKSEHLTGFIYVRENETEHGKPPQLKKGKFELAEANTEPTLIRRAFDLRKQTPILRQAVVDAGNSASATSSHAQPAPPIPVAVQLSPVYQAGERLMASDLLDDTKWTDAVREELGPGVCVKGPGTAWARPTGMRVVHFVLKRGWYELMSTGEKTLEIRKNTRYWRARLCNQADGFHPFEYAEFSHGYHKDRRQFVCRVVGMEFAHSVNMTFSNGRRLRREYKKNGYIIIRLGGIVHKNH